MAGPSNVMQSISKPFRGLLDHSSDGERPSVLRRMLLGEGSPKITYRQGPRAQALGEKR